MKITSLVPLVTILCSSIAWAAEPTTASSQLQVYPKNLARQHLGTNLFLFNPATQAYVPTEASAAWLDDDAATGWPVLAGKQHYLLVLSEPELLTNFSLSTRPASGTVTLYGGDEPAIPGSKAWLTMAKDLPLETVNNKTLAKPFNRFAKYVLIETDITEPGPLFSLYLFGEKSAVSYTLRKREQPIDSRSVFGPYVNDQTNFNVNGLYAGGRVSYSNSPDSSTSWQKAIDDNPATAMIVGPTSSETGAIISLREPRVISRVTVAGKQGAKGQLSVAVKKTASGGEASSTAAAFADFGPAVNLVFDGSNDRASVDFPATEGSEIAVRWTPISSTDTFTLAELSTSSGLSLNDYEVGGSLPVVAEYTPTTSDFSNDGKTSKDIVDPKKNPEPIAAGPGSPYLPGSLGFPPVRTGRRLPPPEPESN